MTPPYRKKNSSKRVFWFLFCFVLFIRFPSENSQNHFFILKIGIMCSFCSSSRKPKLKYICSTNSSLPICLGRSCRSQDLQALNMPAPTQHTHTKWYSSFLFSNFHISNQGNGAIATYINSEMLLFTTKYIIT